jgi:hypothetical protein
MKGMIVAIAWTAAVSAQQHPSMPAGMTHEEHQALMKQDADLKRRGAVAMGFDQDAATHHFRLLPDGGAIEVEANDTGDLRTRDAIRAHLESIAADFAAGRFAAPFATHAVVPPGVPTMQRLRPALAFSYEATSSGGRVRIRSSESEAVSAVHDFLRFQIREHRTGDSLEVAVDGKGRLL